MASSAILATASGEGPSSTMHLEFVRNFAKLSEDLRTPGDFEMSDLMQMKQVVREIFTREESLLTKARILQALASGAGEEVNLMSNILRQLKEEKRRLEESRKQQDRAISKLEEDKAELSFTVGGLRDEVRSREETASSLRSELNESKSAAKARDDESATTVKRLRKELSAAVTERDELLSTTNKLREEIGVLKLFEEERGQMHELQKQEMESRYKERLGSLHSQLDDSLIKLHKFETGSASRLKELEHKDAVYGKWLNHLVAASEDLKISSQGGKSMVLGLQKEWAEWMSVLSLQIGELTKQAEGYHKLFSENRKLYNEVLDLKGNIRVYCRVRPPLPSSHSGVGTVDYIGDNGDIMVVNPGKQSRDSRRIFNFHKVFASSASQEDVYMDTQPLIRSVLDGYNVCIFAYGQTGSGKTYTMSGPNSQNDGPDLGVNYRALNDLFVITESRRDAIQYEIGVQMIEIYNEQVRDLLSAPGSSVKKLEIRNHHAHLNVPDACLMSVTSKGDVLELMKIGGRNRSVGATAINERSSRSHSVLTVHVQGVDRGTSSVLRGSLHLVDLAGSERIEKSEATGDRLKEALHINKSLSALGDVIAALALKSPHVPYRNSKLTQLLQDSLGGQGKALMVVHINADNESYGETISTLKFAERVASVELGAARSNREPGEIRELKEQITNLKEVISQKDAEVERLRSSFLEDGVVRTPSKAKPRVIGGSGGLAPRRLSKDNFAAARRAKPSPDNGFGSTNVRFI